MTYIVEFKEKITLTRISQCEIEAENEEEAKEKFKAGDFEITKEWDDDSESEFIEILRCWKHELKPELLDYLNALFKED